MRVRPLESVFKTVAIASDSHRFLFLTIQGVPPVKLQNSGNYETCTVR